MPELDGRVAIVTGAARGIGLAIASELTKAGALVAVVDLDEDQAAQASAAVMVWKDAFERANSFDVEKVRDALAATDMKTFYGAIKFSKAGNNIAKPMVLRQIQNGKLNIVAPLKWASAPVQHPRKTGM